jgi:hypothetical protein
MANKSSPKEPNTYLGYVQQHERLWGTESYPGRPTLEEMLNAPVAALWYPHEENAKQKPDPLAQQKYTITLHQDLREIESYINRLIFRLAAQVPRHRLAKVFVKGKEVKVKGVRIEFEEVG